MMSIFGVMIGSIQNTQTTSQNLAKVNESFTASAVTYYTLALPAGTYSSVNQEVVTSPNATLTRNVNYTADYTTLSQPKILVNSTWFSGTSLNVSYNWTETVYGAAENVSGKGITALLTMSTLFSPVGLVILASLLLALLFGTIAYLSVRR